MNANLTTGYHQFHPNRFINYQLNRWYGLGYARAEDIKEAARKIKSFSDYTEAFLQASDKAEQEGRLRHAATYQRAAEFLIPPDDNRKIPVYKSFIGLFDKAFADENFERHLVPYAGRYLSAIRLPSRTGTAKGTIMAIPGFDAFIEEFFVIWKHFAEQGYDCIAFEGPGQGGSRRLHHQLFDHDYEKPYAAVLDHFGLQDVTALGVSMGGYWVIRAAAFEKRISKVIAMPPLYDWLAMTNAFNAGLARWFLSHRKLTNFMVKLKMKAPALKHTINNALFIQGKTEPCDAVSWMMAMNHHHINSALVDQDVLLMTGIDDDFQPPVLLHKQEKALENARSVSTRIFTREDQASHHCQIGNLRVALETMSTWLGSL